jgi:hypothetical protein
MNDAEVVLLKCRNTSRIEKRKRGPHQGQRVRRVDKNVPADYGVERSCGAKHVSIGLPEGDLLKPCS